MTKLLGIAPYQELQQSMKQIGSQFEDLQLDTYVANLDEVQELITTIKPHHYDAILSRGGTSELLKELLTTPVIDVSISLYDILSTLQIAKNYSSRFAIIGFPGVTEPAYLLCDILQYKIPIITITNTKEAEQALDKLQQDDYSLVVCDVITNQIAIEKSFRTILITSGNESIRQAFKEAIQISHFMSNTQQKTQLLEQTLNHQSHLLLVLDDSRKVNYSNLPQSLQDSILFFLEKKSLLEGNIYYHSYKKTLYKLSLSSFSLNGEIYSLIEIKITAPPLVNQQFGVTYQHFDDVKQKINQQLTFTTFIEEDSKEKAKQLERYFQTLIISGEKGTSKTSLSYYLFSHQSAYHKNLITIDASIYNDKTWKFLTNLRNGPLIEIDNTLLFQNIDQMPLAKLNQLVTLIKDNNLDHSNRVIFTYNTNGADSEQKIFHRLLDNLDCTTLHTRAIRQRKEELSSLIPLLLNQINIQYNCSIIGFEPDAIKVMIDFPWPGNFPQLAAVVKQLALNTSSYYITKHQVLVILEAERKTLQVNDYHTTVHQLISEDKTLFEYTQAIIQESLKRNKGNQTKTAKQLGISRTTLWRYLNQ